MKRFVFALAAALLLTAMNLPSVHAQSTASGTPSLYKQLGGYDGIAAVTDDFIHRLASDSRFAKFFAGVSDAHKARIRQMFVDLLCAKTGGPCVYVGMDMKTAHQGLHITPADFDASAQLFKQSLDKYSVPAAAQQQLFQIVGALKPDVTMP
ncbi:MAG TPA: group 1 truncated hemoglobin [Candidatus Baltobacteraceae bacterium]|nr:group 1 truncated hemoglobin [Candidatus Baltobacteraceae bacterium]